MIKRRNRLTVLAAVACMGLMAVTFQAAAVHAGRAATPTMDAGRTVGSAGPAREIATRPDLRSSSAQFSSRNWDGYITDVASHGTDFKAIKANWVQPAVTCPKPTAWTVFWVGLDGWWNDTVEQGGSSAQCVKGVPHYTVWWEMYPTNSITTVFAISPGDSITASVTYQPATATFVIFVKDLTTGQSFKKNEQCASNITCDRSSSDVIAEDVGRFGGSSFFPLADYGTVAFTGTKVTDTAGRSGGITSNNWLNAAVTESAGGVTYAIVSGLNNGKGFSATWQHA